MNGLLGAVDPTFDARNHRIPHAPHHPEPYRALPVIDPGFERDWGRGASDGVFWAWRFFGVRVHRDQRRFVRMSCLLSEDDWHILWRTICVSAGNRAGKTLALAIIILHHAFYKTGMRKPALGDRAAVEAWLKAPYNWYHVSYQQTVSRIVHREIVLLLAGDHVAQGNRETGEHWGCPLTKQFPGIAVTDKVYEGLYEWVKLSAAFGGAEIHFRNTNEHGKALLGINMDGISGDEVAFELYLDEVMSGVLDARRGTTGGPIYLISTPDFSDLQFPDLWEEGNPANPNRKAKSLSLRMSTRSNIGYGLTQSEFDDMVADKPKWWIDQHIDGLFVQAEGAHFNAESVEAMFDPALRDVEGKILSPTAVAALGGAQAAVETGQFTLDEPLPEEDEPVKGHRYVQGVDIGMKRDPTWGIVLDLTDSAHWRGVRVRRTFGTQTTVALVNLVREGHLLFSEGSDCNTIVDSTGMQGAMFVQALNEAIWPVSIFDFAGAPGKKTKLLSDLRSVIDSGRLKLPRTGLFWAQLRRQLLSYRLDDRKIEQDGVMALAIAVFYASLNGVEATEADTFDFFGGTNGDLGSEEEPGGDRFARFCARIRAPR